VVEKMAAELGEKVAVAALSEEIDVVLGQQGDQLPRGDRKAQGLRA
jgi:hypothetical protein